MIILKKIDKICENENNVKVHRAMIEKSKRNIHVLCGLLRFVFWGGT